MHTKYIPYLYKTTSALHTPYNFGQINVYTYATELHSCPMHIFPSQFSGPLCKDLYSTEKETEFPSVSAYIVPISFSMYHKKHWIYVLQFRHRSQQTDTFYTATSFSSVHAWDNRFSYTLSHPITQQDAQTTIGLS